MGITTADFVHGYVAEMRDKDVDLDRLVTVPSGLTSEGMIEAISHPDVGRLGIPLMADFMAPTGSIYYDAIFGAFHGQLAIRQWLVPAMAEIEFIDFVPMAEPVMFDDGEGGTSLDEWQMVMNLDGTKIPLSRGVSVRRYRDGWITWACDVYDTAAFRQPPPEMAGPPPPPLPPCPNLAWATDTTARPATLPDPRHIVTPFHPTDSVYIDPIAGELRGEAAITAWLAEVTATSRIGIVEPLGPLVSDGITSVQEWKRRTVRNDGSFTTLRGTSVRRIIDGLVVYAADYYDTTPPSGPEE
ncbi:MAG: hypothetical protein WCC60_17040 [Ilumatobacteraceae bacterium]